MPSNDRSVSRDKIFLARVSLVVPVDLSSDAMAASLLTMWIPPAKASQMDGRKALILAWAIEFVAVGMGLILALYAGLEGGTSGVMGMVIAMLPFIALTVTELAKIPLVHLAFSVRSWAWRIIAVCALACVTFATFENFVFGFERGFTERLSRVAESELAVSQAASAKERAEAKLPQLAARQTELDSRLTALRIEMNSIREQAQADIRDSRELSGAGADLRAERERLDRDLIALEQRRIAELERERRRCQQPDVRCQLGAIEANNRRQRDELTRGIQDLMGQSSALRERVETITSAARARRDGEIEAKERERSALQALIDRVRQEINESQDTSFRAAGDMERLVRSRDELLQQSQMHRLADALQGSHDQAALERTKKLFVLSLAGIVATIGTLIATLHYAAMATRFYRAGKLAMALRAYLARRRRRLPVTAARMRQQSHFSKLLRSLRGWIAHRRRRVVIQEVEIPVDRLKLVYVPLDISERELTDIRRRNTPIEPVAPPQAKKEPAEVDG
jgi:hypothetical protein